jgi:DDE superfamily endonuclease
MPGPGGGQSGDIGSVVPRGTLAADPTDGRLDEETMTPTLAYLERTSPQQQLLPGQSAPRPVVSGAPSEQYLTELCSRVFRSLNRRDQRGKAEQYLRGLLSAQGRKSMRNVAGYLGSTAAEQSLHHFISASTWDCDRVREALADYVEEAVRPQAWVLRPMVIPKAGRHSVGVERRFVPELGQAANCQQAFGVWAASEAVSCPVDWRLHLPDHWMTDQELRRRAKIPADTPWLSLAECAVRTATATATRRGVRRRPVVLALSDADLAVSERRFRAAGVPFLARIGAATRLVAADDAVPGRGAESAAAHLLQLARTRWRPVEWLDPLGGGTRGSMVTAVRVELPGRAGEPLLLLGEWTDLRRGPRQFWLTSELGSTWGRLLRTTKLVQRVEQDFAEVSARVGLMDFEGRCFEGWHRHTTLASVAHTARVLGGRPPREHYGRSERAA